MIVYIFQTNTCIYEILKREMIKSITGESAQQPHFSDSSILYILWYAMKLEKLFMVEILNIYKLTEIYLKYDFVRQPLLWSSEIMLK